MSSPVRWEARPRRRRVFRLRGCSASRYRQRRPVSACPGHSPSDDQDEFADETGAIVVYPNGVAIGDNEGDWLLNTENTGNQDVAFVEAILSGLEARYCIDTNRTYATGYSLGSMYTYDLARANARFAAVASGMQEPCRSIRRAVTQRARSR